MWERKREGNVRIGVTGKPKHYEGVWLVIKTKSWVSNKNKKLSWVGNNYVEVIARVDTNNKVRNVSILVENVSWCE